MVSADTQHSYDFGILVSLIINVVLAVIFVLLFEWWRRMHPAVYESRITGYDLSSQDTIELNTGRPSLKFLGWIKSSWSHSDDTLFKSIGLDALM
jgi:hypothetical protein